VLALAGGQARHEGGHRRHGCHEAGVVLAHPAAADDGRVLVLLGGDVEEGGVGAGVVEVQVIALVVLVGPVLSEGVMEVTISAGFRALRAA